MFAIAVALWAGYAVVADVRAPPSCTLRVVNTSHTPVIDAGHSTAAWAAGVQFGFEGGRAIAGADGTTFLFTAELFKDPVDANMRVAVWRRDATSSSWARMRTVAQSNQSFSLTAFNQQCEASYCTWKGATEAQTSLQATYRCDPDDLMASPWAPQPVFDKAADEWWILYIGYRCNFTWLVTAGKGNVWAARSSVAGIGGLGGPFVDHRLVLGPDGVGPARWGNRSHDGAYYVDQIAPYTLPDGTFAAIVGGNKAAFMQAPHPAGPWRHVGDLPATTFNKTPLSTYNENPVVTRVALSDGRSVYAAVFDTVFAESKGFGAAFSSDGTHWSAGADVTLDGGCRTPLGLLPLPAADRNDNDGGSSAARFEMLFTRRFASCADRTQQDDCGGFGMASIAQCSPIYSSIVELECGS